MNLPNIPDLTRQDAADNIEQQVVGAVIDHDGQVLLLRRPEDDFRGGTWELPSGKVEGGEDLMTALRREVTEETGLYIALVTHYLGAFVYTSGSGRRTRQHTWSVKVRGADQVHLSEHDAHAWTCDSSSYPISAEVKVLVDKHLTAG